MAMILWRADEDATGRVAASKPVAQATPHNQWRWESPRFGQIALDPGTNGAPPLAPWAGGRHQAGKFLIFSVSSATNEPFAARFHQRTEGIGGVPIEPSPSPNGPIVRQAPALLTNWAHPRKYLN
jgi:hypothetical protein